MRRRQPNDGEPQMELDYEKDETWRRLRCNTDWQRSLEASRQLIRLATPKEVAFLSGSSAPHVSAGLREDEFGRAADGAHLWAGEQFAALWSVSMDEREEAANAIFRPLELEVKRRERQMTSDRWRRARARIAAKYGALASQIIRDIEGE